jgi:hypothetical protein
MLNSNCYKPGSLYRMRLPLYKIEFPTTLNIDHTVAPKSIFLHIKTSTIGRPDSATTFYYFFG